MWRTPCCTCSILCCYTIWGVFARCRRAHAPAPARRARRCACAGLAPLTAEILKPLLAHPHARVGGTLHRRRVVAERPRDRGDWRSPCARCWWRRSVCARSSPRWAPCSLAVGLLAADPRLAHAERRARRLSGGARCGWPWPWPGCGAAEASARRLSAASEKQCPRRGRRGPTGAQTPRSRRARG